MAIVAAFFITWYSSLLPKAPAFSWLRNVAIAFNKRTVNVVVFIPPAVEPGEPPISINNIITAFEASLIFEIPCDKKCGDNSHALFYVIFLRRTCNPVSYTHLDVYKRQGKYSSCCHSHQSHLIAFPCYVISIQQQISKNECGLIKHKWIMTAEQNQHCQCSNI